MFIGFRLSDKKDKDLIEALSNSKSISKEVRKLMRAGLKNIVNHPIIEEKRQKREIEYNYDISHIEIDTLIVENEVEIEDIENNILGGFDD